MPAAAPQTAASRYPPKPGEPPVVFDDVSIRFDRNEVLRNVSFRVQPGETRLLRIKDAG